MRSRGTGGQGKRERDLTEAGLSEPADGGRGLWGLCRRRLVRDARSAAGYEVIDRSTTIGGNGCAWLEAGGTVTWRAIRVAAAVDQVTAVLTDEAIPAGVTSVRGEYGHAVGAWESHELSSQNRGRCGMRRGRTPVGIITPPQQGQRPGPRSEASSSPASAGASRAGAPSSLRQSTSLAARWPLARKP